MGRQRQRAESARDETPRQLVYRAAVGRYFVRLHYLDAPGHEWHDAWALDWQLPSLAERGVEVGEKYFINPDDMIHRFRTYLRQLAVMGQDEGRGPLVITAGPGVGLSNTAKVAGRLYDLRRSKFGME